eukprot:1406814-Pleurochrysis_carterae.AAC.4
MYTNALSCAVHCLQPCHAYAHTALQDVREPKWTQGAPARVDWTGPAQAEQTTESTHGTQSPRPWPERMEASTCASRRLLSSS